MNRKCRLCTKGCIGQPRRHKCGQNYKHPSQQLQPSEAHFETVVDEDASPIACDTAPCDECKGQHQSQDEQPSLRSRHGSTWADPEADPTDEDQTNHLSSQKSVGAGIPVNRSLPHDRLTFRKLSMPSNDSVGQTATVGR